MTDSTFLTAQEAASLLNVSLPTLYAYVSRGFVRSEEAEGPKRNRRYVREDIEKLLNRKELKRNPSKVVESALHFGEPVLESAITLIENGRFFYRGYDVVQLAQERTVEEVAALIWTGSFETAHLFATPKTPIPVSAGLAGQVATFPPIERFQAVLPFVASSDLAAYDLAETAVCQTGARILHLLIHTAIANYQATATNLAQTLQQGWIPALPQATPLLSAALILCADHELNVSSFTARCVASAGSTPYAVVMAGLAALQGYKHGGHTERVAALWREIGSPENVRATLFNRLKRGDSIPGFGHKLYPQGDPRFKALWEMISAVFPNSPVLAFTQALVTEVQNSVGQYPTVDLGLVVLAQALQLPSGSAIALFALGRTIGWIGHAIEQYRLDQLIRPRARYVGVGAEVSNQ